MATRKGTESSASRTEEQQTQSAAGAQTTERPPTEQERQVPVARETGRPGTRGTSLAARQPAMLPSLFAAPPGLLASAFLSNPWEFMRRMSEEMDRWFEGTMGRVPTWSGFTGATWMPQVETVQRDNTLVVRADLPGVKREDIHVEVDRGMLTLSGERRQEEETREEGLYRSERRYGSFYRAIPLPEGVNEDQITASYDNGVLEVTVPLPQEQQQRGRRIEIK